MVEVVTCYRPDQECGVCGALGVAYLIVRDEQPTAHLCVDCVRDGPDAAALRARRRGKRLYREGGAALAVSRLIDDVAAGDWPGEWS